jgi:diguanylate cyclase (GGDEF)-like protein
MEAGRRADPAQHLRPLSASEHTAGPAPEEGGGAGAERRGGSRRERGGGSRAGEGAEPGRRSRGRAGERRGDLDLAGVDREVAFRRRIAARRERRRAVAGLTGLAVLLLALLALAAPLHIPHRASSGVAVPIGALAAVLAGTLLFADATRRATPNVILAATLGLTGLIAWLVARTGGTHSAYAALHLAPPLIAGAFLDRRRFAVALLAALGAGLAPALYGSGAQHFLRLAAALAPAGVLAAVVAHLATSAQRADRDTLLEHTAEAVRQAEVDPLTGLGNYRAFWRRLEEEIARARRHRGLFSLILLDLDDFKAVNDEAGHQAGDAALRRAGAALRGALRDEDVCCRQGGDEFAVIAVAAGDLETRELAARLAAGVAAIAHPGGRQITATAGWSTYGRPAGSADEMILLADEALRAAKRHRPLAPQLTLPVADRDDRPDRLATIAGLTRELAGARSERTIAETLAVHAAGTLGATGAQCVRWDGAEETPLTLARVGAAPLHPAELELELAAETLHRRRARVLVAAGAGGREHSELAAPILLGAHPWGYLLATAPRGGSFDAADRELAETLSAEAARALTQAPAFAALPEGELGDLYRLAAELEPATGEAWRVADLAWQVGRRLVMSGDELRELYLAGLFHDIGTAGLPVETLHKADPLEEEERELLRTLPAIGAKLLSGSPTLAGAAPIVRHAQERFDGTGHPDGLAGEEIPLAARILLACDAWVSMTSPRPWRDAFGEEHAHQELVGAAGSMLDPAVVEALRAAVAEPTEPPDL